MAEVVVENISKSFLTRTDTQDKSSSRMHALVNISFTVNSNEFVSIIGPSGCGKTTLIRIIDGLLTPDSGRVLISGKEVKEPGFDRAMVFQQFGLFPWKTAMENIGFGLKMQGVSKEERLERSAHYVKMVGLSGFENYYPYQLSGGMQQRVGIARALCINSRIILMDEPLGAVDAQTREIMQEEILRIWNEDRKTVLFVTHSIDEAVYMSDRIILLKPRPGMVEEIIDVPLPRPRFENETRKNPQFGEIRSYIWQKLRQHVQSDLSGGAQ